MYERKVRLSGVLDELKERGEGGGEMEDTLMCKKNVTFETYCYMYV